MNQAPSTARAIAWHLFAIEAQDAAGTHAYMVSADSDSATKAEELARAAVLDDVGTDDEPGTISSCRRLGLTDSDIFERVGLLAD